jgi:MFS family permease
MITAACSNFAGLAICRFLLGVFESVITPVWMMIIGMWYIRREQPARAGAFYCCNGLGNMMGGILFYAVGHARGFPVWKIIFLLCGSVTFCWGIILAIFLPNNITTAKRFTVEEKAHLIARSQTNRTGVYNKKIKMNQVWESFRDPQVWILFLFTLLNEIINGGYANFGKLIVKNVAGGDALLATAYGIPSGAFQVFFVSSGPLIASKFTNVRTYVMPAYIVPTIIGAALLWKLPRTNTTGCLLGYYIVCLAPNFPQSPETAKYQCTDRFQLGAYVASLVLALQMPATNVGGYTKRVTCTAFVFLAYCIGNVIGPHTFLAEEAPIYQTGCKVIMACASGQIVLALLLRGMLIRRNKLRDQAAAASGNDGSDLADGALLEDLTDFENPRFRYSY